VLSASLTYLDADTKEQIRAADLGSSAPTTLTGQLVIAVGRPIGTSGSISYGAVSSASANLGIVDSGLMQITTDIYGSKQSSGFLLNPDGLVVGIIDPYHVRPDLPNLLCAIGISECKQLIEKLSSGGKKAYLGVQCTDVPDDVRERIGIPEGVYLSEVSDESPAMKAGLQKGDVITRMGDEKVRYSTVLSRILLESDPGTELSVSLMRPNGEGYTEMEITVTLE
jgi:S1-C subfamily serine protease